MPTFVALLCAGLVACFTVWATNTYMRHGDNSIGAAAWISGIVSALFMLVAICLTTYIPRAPDPWELTSDEQSSLYRCASTEGCDAVGLHRSFIQGRGDPSVE